MVNVFKSPISTVSFGGQAFKNWCTKLIQESNPGGLHNALNEYVHTYIKEDSEGFNFDFFYEKGIDNLKIETRCFKKSIKTNKTLEFNQIKNIYNSHSENELRDLVNLRYKYSNNYIKILTEDTFKNLKISKIFNNYDNYHINWNVNIGIFE